MQEEIKQRIKLIKNGEVPQGYKKTKVGIIPIDWEIKKLIDLTIGKGVYGINAPGCEYNENLPLYLRITDIDDFGKYIKSNRVCVNDKESYKFNLKENDLVFARTGATTGKTYLYNKDDGNLVFAGFLIKFSINDKVSNSYIISQYCKMERYWNWVDMISIRSGQPGINAEEYSKLKLSYTKNLREQKKIADILSTQDKIIELKQKLIEEKQKQKKYLMQNLLTGKIKLKGFNDKWEKVKLGDICNITTGKLNANAMVKNGKYKFFTCSKETFLIDNFAFDCEAILISGNGDVGHTKLYKGKFNAYQRTYVLKDFKYDIFLIKQYIDKYLPKKINEELQQGAMSYIKLNTLKKLYFKVPLNIKEQNKIAEILSKADEEIELLQKDLEQEQLKKKSLMQLLLTGIVRV